MFKFRNSANPAFPPMLSKRSHVGKASVMRYYDLIGLYVAGLYFTTAVAWYFA